MTDVLSPPIPAAPAADEAQNQNENTGTEQTGTEVTAPATTPEATAPATEPTTSEPTSPVNDDLAKALSGVSGLGPAKQEHIAQTFGSLDKLKSATVDELTAIKGVGVGVAERILATVNGKPVEAPKPRKATAKKASAKKSTAKAASAPAASSAPAPTKVTSVSVSGNVLTVETSRGPKQFELDRPSLILDLNQDVRAAAQEFVSSLSL